MNTQSQTNPFDLFTTELIEKTQKTLFIAEPCLQLTPALKNLITDKEELNIDIRLIYRKNSLTADDIFWLRNHNNVHFFLHKDLERKFYLNENSAVLPHVFPLNLCEKEDDDFYFLVHANENNGFYTTAEHEINKILLTSRETFINSGFWLCN